MHSSTDSPQRKTAVTVDGLWRSFCTSASNIVVHLHQIPWKCINVEVASSPALLDMSVFHHFSVKYRFVIFALKLYYAG